MSRILICTIAYNRPDFIEYQYKTLQKFLQNPFIYVVYNNSNSKVYTTEIKYTCERLGVIHERIPQDIHPSEDTLSRCTIALNYMLHDRVLNYDGIVCIMDSDMFLIDKLDIERSIRRYDILAVKHSHRYLPGIDTHLMFLRPKNLPNNTELDLSYKVVEGGNFRNYLEKYPDVYVLEMEYIPSLFNKKWILPSIKNPIIKEYYIQDPDENKNSYIELYHDQTILHYKYGSNWIGFSEETLIRRDILLYTCLNKILE